VAGVRARKHRRAPRLYRPWLDVVASGLLLIFVFGIMLAGAHDAWLARDYAWMWFFLGADVVVIIVYTKFCVLGLIRWLDNITESQVVDRPVDVVIDSRYDGRHRDHHHPGEH
jgi:hypothetical protein